MTRHILACRLKATLFTNLEAVPGMATISMAHLGGSLLSKAPRCCCFLAECMDRLWLFYLSLLSVGLAILSRV